MFQFYCTFVQKVRFRQLQLVAVYKIMADLQYKINHSHMN